MVTRARIATVAAVALAGCIDLHPADGQYTCATDDPRCPPGLACDPCTLRCLSAPTACDGGVPDLAAPSDLAAPADLATQADLAQPGCGLPVADAAPAAIPPLRFDVAQFTCAPCGRTCADKVAACLCLDELSHLAYGTAHYLALSDDTLRPYVWRTGNRVAAWVFGFDDGWAQTTGTARAAELLGDIGARFASGTPDWLLLDGISHDDWSASAGYRAFVVDLARHLAAAGKSVVFFSPFESGDDALEWNALADAAYIGIECFSGTTGKLINASGNDATTAMTAYGHCLDGYAALGITPGRLFLVDSYANTGSGPSVNWGRAGVSAAGWANAIDTRARAVQAIAPAGFISLGWGNNQMADTSATRIGFIDRYAASDVP